MTSVLMLSGDPVSVLPGVQSSPPEARALHPTSSEDGVLLATGRRSHTDVLGQITTIVGTAALSRLLDAEGGCRGRGRRGLSKRRAGAATSADETRSS